MKPAGNNESEQHKTTQIFIASEDALLVMALFVCSVFVCM